MTETMQRKPIKRHTVSELDGTQVDGLAVVIALLGGMVIAATLVPGALTSFWVWVALLIFAVTVALSAQQVFGRTEHEDDS